MLHQIRIILIIFPAMFSCACVSVDNKTNSNIQKVSFGMPIANVTEIMGEPVLSKRLSETEICRVYKIKEGQPFTDIIFISEQVFATGNDLCYPLS